jgi:hypothetical protein
MIFVIASTWSPTNAQVAELADALDSGAKSAIVATALPSIQTSENPQVGFVAHWRVLADF